MQLGLAVSQQGFVQSPCEEEEASMAVGKRLKSEADGNIGQGKRR
jgi:hypothetical protein